MPIHFCHIIRPLQKSLKNDTSENFKSRHIMYLVFVLSIFIGVYLRSSAVN